MSNDSVDLILHILVFCKDFSLLCLFYDTVDKRKPLSVGSLHRILIMQVDIRLDIRSFLTFAF